MPTDAPVGVPHWGMDNLSVVMSSKKSDSPSVVPQSEWVVEAPPHPMLQFQQSWSGTSDHTCSISSWCNIRDMSKVCFTASSTLFGPYILSVPSHLLQCSLSLPEYFLSTYLMSGSMLNARNTNVDLLLLSAPSKKLLVEKGSAYTFCLKRYSFL